MRILLDKSVPRRLKRDLIGHDVSTVPEMDWRGKQNGELLRLAEQDFDVFIIVDQNLEYQQNLSRFHLSYVLLVSPKNTYEMLSVHMPSILKALKTLKTGDFVRIGD
jgi:hypothetical protein